MPKVSTAGKAKGKVAKKPLTKANSSTRTRVPIWQPAFLKAYAELGVIAHACKVAGVSRPVVHERKHNNKEFAALYEQAHKDACDSLQIEAIRRARDGYERPIYQGGVLVGTEKVYSDNLLNTLLKAKLPDEYREHQTIKHEGAISFNTLSEKAKNVSRKDREIKNNPALTGEVEE